MNSQSPDPSTSGGGQSGVAEELKHDASRLKSDLTDRAKQEAEGRKSQATQLAGSASSALETAAQDLRDNPDAPDWMASALQQAASSIQGLARRVEGRSIDQLGEDVMQFARSNPGTFLAASAAAGFAASRVLRAGIDRKRHDRAGQQDAAQNGQAYSDPSTGWAADENIRPNTAGGFAPAYAEGSANEGGTIR